MHAVGSSHVLAAGPCQWEAGALGRPREVARMLGDVAHQRWTAPDVRPAEASLIAKRPHHRTTGAKRIRVQTNNKELVSWCAAIYTHPTLQRYDTVYGASRAIRHRH